MYHYRYLWILIQMSNYTMIKTYFIDKKWELHEKIINCALFSNYKGEVIGKFIEKCMID